MTNPPNPEALGPLYEAGRTSLCICIPVELVDRVDAFMAHDGKEPADAD